MNLVGPIEIQKHYKTDKFDCGKEPLNSWLQKFAWQSQQARSARTYVIVDGDNVIGYHSLASSAIMPADASDRAKKGLPNSPIPVILLARMAVTKPHLGSGLKLGAVLLRDAFLKTLNASKGIGVRALLVHAKDDEAASFYRYFGFETSPTHPLHLMILVKDLEHNAG